MQLQLLDLHLAEEGRLVRSSHKDSQEVGISMKKEIQVFECGKSRLLLQVVRGNLLAGSQLLQQQQKMMGDDGDGGDAQQEGYAVEHQHLFPVQLHRVQSDHLDGHVASVPILQLQQQLVPVLLREVEVLLPYVELRSSPSLSFEDYRLEEVRCHHLPQRRGSELLA